MPTTFKPTTADLYRLAANADKAFTEALKKAYGKHAGDMRYQTKKQSPEIQELGRLYRQAIDEWREAYRAESQELLRDNSKQVMA
jgi:hypothetical protein